MDVKNDKEDLALSASLTGGVQDAPTLTDDAVFGIISEDGPNYRNLGWMGTSILMMKTQIGLGVLSIPSAFDALGLVPGVICLIVIAATMSWSGYMVGVFKLNHREVYGIDDATGLMFGPAGREILGMGLTIFLIFCGASGILGLSIALNAVSNHGACTAVFVAVAAIVVLGLASIQTLDRISVLAWAGLACMLTSILIVAIAVGIQNHPDAAPPGPWVSDYKIVNSPSFTDGMSAISQFIFAYAGTPFFFPIVSEMRDPRHYKKSLTVCQTVVTVTYITIGTVVYYFCGSYVSSPALGSAGKLIKRIAYGISLPGLFVTSTISTHMASKYIFLRFMRGSKHLAANTLVHWATWLACVFGVIVVAYIIASGIPIFGSLISLVGALLGTLQCFQPAGCMWLYDNWGKGKEQQSLLWRFMVCFSVAMIVIGTFLMICGTYGAVVGIIDSLKADETSGAWSCADNS
ncbi:unnamed protein product [Penicillium salamii]|uniref:Amino acid transporter transmembrane domain-containing protein n=1 Tax=Penicillium salamii TaxID=1612424 RepID=A0A9W4NXU8_9EURO|nr:unnamed protein product [Penicillium salamii]CAG7961318.1 unnamed protein product [Penicillium salamii]CAG8057995.1 unnamed protein product [Penicillium salamii]CAG8068545.1 unnamed protein product [Penicillium salamii]CAG8152862.1 unnamed protein product [Penicillium salamii]